MIVLYEHPADPEPRTLVDTCEPVVLYVSDGRPDVDVGVVVHSGFASITIGGDGQLLRLGLDVGVVELLARRLELALLDQSVDPDGIGYSGPGGVE